MSTLRIIAGRLKGRRLTVPPGMGTRPTSDRLRETLFNIVTARVPGACVLDAYAGSGAVGIEALSRGASHVTFIERDARAAASIAQNLATCGQTDVGRIERGDVAAVLRRGDLPRFSLAFLDPPYADVDLLGVLDAAAACLEPTGLLVLEHATRTPPIAPPSLSLVRRVRAGDSSLSFFEPTAHG